MDYSQRYRKLLSSGRGRDLALGVLREEGADFIACVKAIYEVERLSLRECKLVAHKSPAWSGERQTREAFWNDVASLIEWA